MASGWAFKAAISNSDLLTDSVTGDAVFRTDDRNARFLFGLSNGTASALLVDRDGVDVNGDAVAARFVCGSTVLTTPSSLIDSGVIEGQIATTNLPDAGVTSLKITDSNILTNHIADDQILTQHVADAQITSPLIADDQVLMNHIADSNVSAAKLSEVLPVVVGGTGNSNLTDGCLLIGAGGFPVDTDVLLQWNSAASTLDAANISVTGNLSVGARSDVEQALDDIEASIAALSNDAATGAGIGDSNILSRHIAASNVLEVHLAEDSVTSLKIADSNVLSNHLADDQILTQHVADAQITSPLLADSNVLSNHLADDQILTQHVADAQITSPLLADSNVLSNHLADDQILTQHVADAQITSPLLADSNVLSNHLADDQILTQHVADAQITSPLLADSNVLSNHLADDQILTQHVADAQITSPLLADSNVLSNHLADDQILTQHVADAQITSPLLADSNVLSNHLADDQILTQHVADAQITSPLLADSNVLSNHLADDQILTQHVADSNITASKLAEVLPVVVGGTGNSSISEGCLVIGAGYDPLQTAIHLRWTDETMTLTACNVAGDGLTYSNIAAGTIAVGDRPDVEQALDDADAATDALAASVLAGDAIGDSNILSRHLADSNVLSQHIADSNIEENHILDGSVPPNKLSGVIPAERGGTGLDQLSEGYLLFGPSVAGEPLAYSSALQFDDANSNLTSCNMFADRVHAGSNVIMGEPGSTRYRFFVGGDSNDLIISRIDSNNDETAYLNLGDLVVLLSNINIYDP
nr:hypothetical protein TetV2_00447 [Oceanusvirus sp.]